MIGKNSKLRVEIPKNSIPVSKKACTQNQICIAVFETLLEEKRITFEEYQAAVRFIK